MQFTTLLYTLAAAALVSAAPAAQDSYPPTYDPPSYPAPVAKTPICSAGTTALCCQLDVLGVVDASCIAAGHPYKYHKFHNFCATSGRTAECCTLDVDGIALLCEEP